MRLPMFLISAIVALQSLSAFAGDQPIKKVVITLADGQQIVVESPDPLPPPPPALKPPRIQVIPGPAEPVPLKIGQAPCNCPQQQQERLLVQPAREVVVQPQPIRYVMLPQAAPVYVPAAPACVPAATVQPLLVPTVPACVPAAGIMVPADYTIKTERGLFGIRWWSHHADGSVDRHGPAGTRQVKPPSR